MLSCSRPVERCRPHLGTFVRVRVNGLEPEHANAAIDAAYEEIAHIHRLMSFHEAQSDVSRLNREASLSPVVVDIRTYEVLARALEISRDSDGAFDITIAPELAARGLLPTPDHAPAPDATAMWRDIALLEERRVSFAKPLWIDLGGIAKGYAVDRAIAALQAYSLTQACVNAGGDLRVTGLDSECVRLAPDHCDTGMTAVVDLENASLASSCGRMTGRRVGQIPTGCHVDTHHGRATHAPQFVSVVAPRCMDADALTKVVMARGACSVAILAKYTARALVHDAQFGWRSIQEAA